METDPIQNEESESIQAEQEIPIENPNTSARLKDFIIVFVLNWLFLIAVGIATVVLMAGGSNPMSPSVVLVTTLATFAFTLLSSWYFVCKKYRKSMVDGFQISPVDKKLFIKSALIGVGGAAIATVVMTNMGTEDSFMSELVEAPGGLQAIAIIALLSPFVEEMYYRGFLFPVLKNKWGSGTAIVIVSVWFMLVHVGQLTGDPIGIAVIFCMGLLWTIQRNRYDSITPSIISHWTYNASLIGLSYVSFFTN